MPLSPTEHPGAIFTPLLQDVSAGTGRQRSAVGLPLSDTGSLYTPAELRLHNTHAHMHRPVHVSVFSTAQPLTLKFSLRGISQPLIVFSQSKRVSTRPNRLSARNS